MKITYRSVLSVFRLASDILNKIPNKEDGPLDIFFKLLAIGDSLDKQYGSKKFDVLDRFSLEERTSSTFVKLFFGTQMSSRFKITKFKCNEHSDFVRAESPDGESLFFQEHTWGGKPEMSPTFYYTEKFNFPGAMNQLWESYPSGLYLAVMPARYGEMETTFDSVPRNEPVVMSAKGRARAVEYVEMHRAARARGKHRAYLFVGPPGTGKSDLAQRMAHAHGGRMLNLDASSVTQIDPKEFGFLLDTLRPNFLVLDDFDEAPVDGARSRLRTLFAHLKQAHSSCSIVITVNNPIKVDFALLRSGRIDVPVDFELPDTEERRDLIDQLLAHHEIRLLPAIVDDLVTRSDKFDHSDIVELCGRMLDESPEAALKSVARLCELAEAAAKAGQGPPGAPGDSKSASPDPICAR